MINHMKDFQMVEDPDNPEIVWGDGTLLQAFISIVICYHAVRL